MKKFSIIIIISIILIGIGVILFQNSNSELITENISTSNNLNVVTTVSPITNIVQNIGGDKITIVGLVPEGVNSHTFELSPFEVIKIQNSDLVIMNGLNLEIGIEKIANNSENKNLQLLKLGDDTITEEQLVFDFSFPKNKGNPNPHLWLNVGYTMNYAELIKEKLVEMDPENTEYYTANTKKYLELLEQLDKGIAQSVQTIPEENRKLITYHDSWAYFTPRYGMEIVDVIQPSNFGGVTPQEVARIIDQIKEENIPAVFASQVFQSKIVDQIARESNIEFVEALVDDALPGNIGDSNHTYVGMMLENMQNMIIPLGGNIDALKNVDVGNTYSPSNKQLKK